MKKKLLPRRKKIVRLICALKLHAICWRTFFVFTFLAHKIFQYLIVGIRTTYDTRAVKLLPIRCFIVSCIQWNVRFVTRVPWKSICLCKIYKHSCTRMYVHIILYRVYMQTIRILYTNTYTDTDMGTLYNVFHIIAKLSVLPPMPHNKQ